VCKETSRVIAFFTVSVILNQNIQHTHTHVLYVNSTIYTLLKLLNRVFLTFWLVYFSGIVRSILGVIVWKFKNLLFLTLPILPGKTSISDGLVGGRCPGVRTSPGPEFRLWYIVQWSIPIGFKMLRYVYFSLLMG
jgi:hypothetical protein